MLNFIKKIKKKGGKVRPVQNTNQRTNKGQPRKCQLHIAKDK